MDDIDIKLLFSFYVILGIGVYVRIRIDIRLRIGNQGEFVVKRIKFGWVIFFLGEDFEELCRLDVLGFADILQYDQGEVYKEFREQLLCSEVGWYEVVLLWKGNYFSLFYYE